MGLILIRFCVQYRISPHTWGRYFSFPQLSTHVHVFPLQQLFLRKHYNVFYLWGDFMSCVSHHGVSDTEQGLNILWWYEYQYKTDFLANLTPASLLHGSSWWRLSQESEESWDKKPKTESIKTKRCAAVSLQLFLFPLKMIRWQYLPVF